ncbi:MAG TPA: response regulator transcription factor [Clostridia bacterium]|nr:response regulator transcription factor [Clostridia bacterium]
MNESNIRILIVEDEEKIAEVVKSYLEKNGFKAFCAYNGSAALELFEKVNPRLVVLDLMLPDMSGEDICRTIRKKSRVPVIMLTAKVEEESILNGLGIGADDYVTKPFSPRQLVARVIALLRRSDDEIMPLANEISFNNGELVVDSIRHEIKKEGQPVNLTPNEYKILMSLIKYPQKAFTRDELVYLVLGEDYEGYDRTIDTHVKNLRQKIEPDVRAPKYILTVYGVGYKFGGE